MGIYNNQCSSCGLMVDGFYGNPQLCVNCIAAKILATPGSKNDAVNHPEHYNSSPAKCSCGKTIECIEVARHMNFNIGNAVKYLWRQGLKNDAIEDLKKAVWYIEDEIKSMEKK
jgi:Protein of unknwon function (DUF3310)